MISIVGFGMAAAVAAQSCGSSGEDCEDWCVGPSCGRPPKAIEIAGATSTGEFTLDFKLAIDVAFETGSSVTVFAIYDVAGDEILALTASADDSGEVALAVTYRISPGLVGRLPVGELTSSEFDVWRITWDAVSGPPSLAVQRNLKSYSASPPALSGVFADGVQGVVHHVNVEGWVSMTAVTVE